MTNVTYFYVVIAWSDVEKYWSESNMGGQGTRTTWHHYWKGHEI